MKLGKRDIFSSTFPFVVSDSEGFLVASDKQLRLMEGEELPATEILIVIYCRAGRCGERAAALSDVPGAAPEVNTSQRHNLFHSGAA